MFPFTSEFSGPYACICIVPELVEVCCDSGFIAANYVVCLREPFAVATCHKRCLIGRSFLGLPICMHIGLVLGCSLVLDA